jgi:hypothetical protein
MGNNWATSCKRLLLQPSANRRRAGNALDTRPYYFIKTSHRNTWHHAPATREHICRGLGPCLEVSRHLLVGACWTRALYDDSLFAPQLEQARKPVLNSIEEVCGFVRVMTDAGHTTSNWTRSIYASLNPSTLDCRVNTR